MRSRFDVLTVWSLDLTVFTGRDEDRLDRQLARLSAHRRWGEKRATVLKNLKRRKWSRRHEHQKAATGGEPVMISQPQWRAVHQGPSRKFQGVSCHAQLESEWTTCRRAISSKSEMATTLSLPDALTSLGHHGRGNPSQRSSLNNLQLRATSNEY